MQRLGDHLVAGGDPGAGIHHEQDRLGLGNGGQTLLGHAAGNGAGRGVFKAGGIDHPQRQAVEHRFADAAIARHPGRVMHDGDAPPDQPVENAGLAHIGAPDDGKRERHDVMSLPQGHKLGIIGVDKDRTVGGDGRDRGAALQFDAAQKLAGIGRDCLHIAVGGCQDQLVRDQ